MNLHKLERICQKPIKKLREWPIDIIKSNKWRLTNPIPEEKYVSLLRCNENEKKKYDAVNSIFRGISVSDSEPISDRDFVLCRKKDVQLDGSSNDINLIRECVRPDTTIHFRVTLDQFLLNGRITTESLMEDIATFARFRYQNYVRNGRRIIASQF